MKIDAEQVAQGVVILRAVEPPRVRVAAQGLGELFGREILAGDLRLIHA